MLHSDSKLPPFFEIVQYTIALATWRAVFLSIHTDFVLVWFYWLGMTWRLIHLFIHLFFFFNRPWGSRAESDCIASLMRCVALLAYLNHLWSPTSFVARNRFHPSSTQLALPFHNSTRPAPRQDWGEVHLVKSKMWISLGAIKTKGAGLRRKFLVNTPQTPPPPSKPPFPSFP